MNYTSESEVEDESLVTPDLSNLNEEWINTSSTGNSSIFNDSQEYIYDRAEVRLVFIMIYSVVFFSCFFGNLLVILVVTLSRRLRSTTNFFLANLAVADLCVGLFCVFQNLTIYLITSWVFGEFLCKMYQFVHSLSYTASIFILVVISTERYLAIIHPIRCKQILTPTRLRLVIALVWITSTVYSSPRFIYVETIVNNLTDGQSETICILPRNKFNSKLFDIINFVLLYVIPLCVMTVLYTLIAVRLWNSSLNCPPPRSCKMTGSLFRRPCAQSNDLSIQIKFEKRPLSGADSRVSINSERSQASVQTLPRGRGATSYSAVSYRVSSSRNVLRARRGVIRMLIAVVLTFAFCNLPIHARKMWQYWSKDYVGSSTFSSLFTPLTFLFTYCNSAINPLLYAFLSRNFQKGMKELSMCNCKARNNATGLYMNHHNSSFHMRSSTKSMSRACGVSNHDR